jgi:eukaryotic-like serine/threonine-protein kinase
VTEDQHAVGCPKAAFVNFTSRLRSATAEGESPEKSHKTDLPDLSGTTVGRFSLQVRLGRGGMGEVYRAYDTKLKRLVALKRIVGAPDDLYRERLWTEAQYASRLNDARIAAVYDMFEEGNEVFLVMEYVEGRTLRERLNKPISISKFLEIAAECAEGLAAAHKGGVLHHDIKPENIMLTSSDQVKMLDFGVARRLPTASVLSTQIDNCSDRGKVSGTLAYMAPEVLEESESDERADIFSLGVIFYEALAGRHPFLTKGFLATCNRILKENPAPLRTRNPRVSPEFERIVNKMLAKNPAERYVSAADLLVDLRALQRSQGLVGAMTPTPPVSAAVRADQKARGWLRGAGLFAGLVCLLALGNYLYRAIAAPIFGAHDRMLVADFENHSGEPLFDETVGELLGHELQQSRYLNIVPRTEAVAAARLAGRQNVDRIDVALGEEICQRENYRVVLTGDVVKAGSGYEIYVKVMDPKQDSALFADKEALRSTSELYAAVDMLAKRLRSHLGESMAQIDQRSVPLAQVTTPSLEALKRYSAAMKKYSAGDIDGFLPLAKSAVEIDPGFAMAHLYLARAYYQLGNVNEFRGHMKLARSEINHVSERERFVILAVDYSANSLEEKSLEQYRLLTELYPDDIEGLQGLAEESALMGKWADAIAAEKHLLQMNPHSGVDYNRLILWLNDTSQFPAAIETYSSAQTNGVKAAELHWGTGLAYLGEENPEKAREQFQMLSLEGGDYEKGLAAISLARVLIYQGRLKEATDALHTGIVLAEKQHSDMWIPVYRYLLASVLLLRGKTTEARAESQRLSATAPQRETEVEELRRAGMVALDVGDIAGAQAGLGALAKLNETQDSAYTHSCYYNLKGAIELAIHKPEDAEESQRRAAVYLPFFSAYEGLANALEAQHKWKEAAQAYQHLLDFKGEVISDDSPAYWVVANLRLARVLAQGGEQKEALRYYDEFLRLWANADSDLPVLLQARDERARTRQGISSGPGTAAPQGR